MSRLAIQLSWNCTNDHISCQAKSRRNPNLFSRTDKRLSDMRLHDSHPFAFSISFVTFVLFVIEYRLPPKAALDPTQPQVLQRDEGESGRACGSHSATA
jgi:hypothetical protein